MLKLTIILLVTECLSFFVIQPVIANNENPIVTTSLGRIKGSILTTVQGKSIYSFRGIRYAKAPINDLRFKPPVPVNGWNGIYDATKDGPACPQRNWTPVSEDCLFLNVYSTKLPYNSDNPLRPVVVFIHPGGFYSFTGSSIFVGPQYWMDQDIVLVTLNHRLGSLGFISTGDELAPGNNGLKDQVVALKWVQKHISIFGGNPNLVTLCGYTAGASSVSLHLVSPMSQGLFHRAIMMSASLFGQVPIPPHQFNLAQKQARLVGCPDDTSANIINCLKTKPAQELADSLPGFFEFRLDPILIWTPVVEPDFGQERFLTEYPLKQAQCGNFAKVPIMAGLTRDATAQRPFDLIENPSYLTEMDQNWDTVAPIAFMYERDTPNSIHISTELREFYFGNTPINNSSFSGLVKIYADGLTGFTVNRAVKVLASKNTQNVYYYRFNYEGRYSNLYLPGTDTPYGVVTNDELIYMFYMSTMFPKFSVTDPEYKMVKKWTTLLTNFATTGNPTPTPKPALDNVTWEPFTAQTKKFIDVAQPLKMLQNLHEIRYGKWASLFPLPTCNP